MHAFLMWSGWAVGLFSLSALLFGYSAARKVPDLDQRSAPGAMPPQAPRVSLIAPACNEAEAVEAAVRSMLRQDYPNLELIVINDRSTDATGAILDRLAAANQRLRVLHVQTLPPGWLGKNHALYTGYTAASGQWLLFADADVQMHASTVRRAIAYAEQQGLDHIALVPDMAVRGYWLTGWVAFFSMAFASFKQPYKANDPKSKKGMGIGAFNLIRRGAYETIGTHQAISLRPDDDLRLGQRVKLMGLRQNVLFGSGLLSVQWYPTLAAAVQGLEKNTLAGFEYKTAAALVSVATLLAVMVYPFVGVFFARGPALAGFALAIVAQWALFLAAGRLPLPRGLWLLPGYPIFALLFAYTVLRAVWLCLVRGGITWRGTFYSLQELRSQSGLPG